MGLEKTRNIHRIIIHPDNPDIVYVGAIGSPWGDHKERGVFKTTDGGETWEHILYVDEKTGVGDMVMDPSNPNKILVNMWQHRRLPWFFESGGPSSGLYMTLDGGKSWTRQTHEENGLPEGDLGRMGLAFAHNKPSRVYALIEAKENALYRSDDGGFTWEMVNNKGEIGNRPFYYFDIYTDPQNENRLYSLFTYVNVSEDGGVSFESLFERGLIHVDNHAFYVNPDDPDFLILGNDGGLAISRDRGKHWRFVANLPVGQFYHIAVDNEIPYNVYGGLQDNGSYTGPAYVWKQGGIRNDYFFPIGGGDGFDVVPDPDDSRYGYSMSQQGYVSRYDKLTGRSKYIRPIHPDPNVRLRFNWNAAIAQDPFDNSTIYFGSQFVHKSTNKGDSWEVISPDLTTNDTTKQKQHLSGGLTIDATGAENHTTILVIEPSPVEPGVIWVGTDDGNVQITRDGGATWTNVAGNIKKVPEGSWVNQIKASTYNKGEAVAVINNYRRFDFKPYLVRTKDYGKSWEVLADEKDVFGYALSFVQDPVEPNLMFFGTEHGLYISIDGAKNWTKFDQGYPSVSTMDMVIQQRESDLVIGTFGRGIWVLDDIRPLRVLASKGQENVAKAAVTAIQPAVAYIHSNRDASGPANTGNATWVGENRNTSGGIIKFFAKKPAGREQGASPNPTARRGGGAPPAPGLDARPGARAQRGENGAMATILITDQAGNHVRKLTTAIEDGMNQVNWRLDEDPLEEEPSGAQASRRFQAGGAPVLPGTYNVEIKVGDASDRTTIEVRMDPRENIPMPVLIARRDMIREVSKISAEVNKMATTLANDIARVDKVIAALKDKKDQEAMALAKQSRAIKEEMEELQKYVGTRGRGFWGRGGDPNDPTPLTTRASTLLRSISGSYDMPGKTQQMLRTQLDEALAEVKPMMETWYAQNWKSYLQEVEKVDFTPIDTDND